MNRLIYLLAVLFALGSPGPVGAAQSDGTRSGPATLLLPVAPEENARFGLDLSLGLQGEKEYLPELGREIHRLTEQYWQLRGRFAVGDEGLLTVAWRETWIEQKNLLYQDLDFSLKAQGPVVGLSLPLAPRLELRAEVAADRFSDDKSAFFEISDSQQSTGFSGDNFFTGFVEVLYEDDRKWGSVSFLRTRDTEPYYDPIPDRPLLFIRVEDFIGLAGGWSLRPEWEVGLSVYHERYETDLANQFNLNGELAYTPTSLAPLRLALGYAYYTEERENLINLSGSYWHQWRDLTVDLGYQLEYSENERSLLNEINLLFEYKPRSDLTLSLGGSYGKEMGDDRDTIYAARFMLLYLF